MDSKNLSSNHHSLYLITLKEYLNLKNSKILDSEHDIMYFNWSLPAKFLLVYDLLNDSKNECKECNDFYESFLYGFLLAELSVLMAAIEHLIIETKEVVSSSNQRTSLFNFIFKEEISRAKVTISQLSEDEKLCETLFAYFYKGGKIDNIKDQFPKLCIELSGIISTLEGYYFSLRITPSTCQKCCEFRKLLIEFKRKQIKDFLTFCEHLRPLV
jgi:hypothetical protein